VNPKALKVNKGILTEKKNAQGSRTVGSKEKIHPQYIYAGSNLNELFAAPLKY